MTTDPAADGGGIEPASVIETAVLVLPRGRVIFGLGMTQQHQTAHGRNLDSVQVWIRVSIGVWISKSELIYKLMAGTR
jgi:hypothetical protein